MGIALSNAEGQKLEEKPEAPLRKHRMPDDGMGVPPVARLVTDLQGTAATHHPVAVIFPVHTCYVVLALCFLPLLLSRLLKTLPRLPSVVPI